MMWSLHTCGGWRMALLQQHLRSISSRKQLSKWRRGGCSSKLADITGFCIRLSDYNWDEAHLKRKMMDNILSLTPIIEALDIEHHLLGMEEHVNTCIKKLGNTFSVASILGLVDVGGIGKTSLVKKIYNYCVGHMKF